MVAVARNRIAGIFQKQLGVLRFDLKILRRLPEVVHDHHAIFISKFKKLRLGIITHPVADDVHMRILLQPEIRLHAVTRNPLHGIVHPPVAATCGNFYTINADGKMRLRDVIIGDWRYRC